MSAPLARIVVVGASVAGITAVETLRRLGYAGSITLVGDEEHLPYDRPPLSKQVLTGAWEPDRTIVRDHTAIDGLNVDMRLGVRAVGLDSAARTIALSDGQSLSFDGLIIATGITPRQLPAGHHLTGVHTLRTIEDSLALRASLRPGQRLVVIGAGFLGCEVAAVARKAGLEVSVVDPLAVPMLRQLGHSIGQHAAALHRAQGVALHCGSAVRRLHGDDAVTGVELESGTILDADAVLVAIGSVPATNWLHNSGLSIDNGVVCDSTCRAAPGIYAAGDVARWWHNDLKAYVRVEHRMNATEQAIAAATNLLGADTPFTPVPYFWTDQYDVKIQGYGHFSADATTTVAQGHPDDGRFLVHYLRDDRIEGVLAWNMPREVRAERLLVGQLALQRDSPLLTR